MYDKSSKTKEPENSSKAYEYAVFLLSLKLRTIGEVLKKMADRGYTQAVIEQTIEQLKSQHYLDDQRYAEIFLENLKAYKNFGYYGIKKKFMEKKLPAALIDQVLADGLSLKDEEKIARRFLNKETSRSVIPSAAEESLTVKTNESFFGHRFRGRSDSRSNTPQDDTSEDELTYRTFDESASKEKQKLAARLKSRGFRGGVITRLLF